MSMDAFNLGFIGAGKMAESIAKGISKSGVLPPSNICTAHNKAHRRDAFSSFGVKVFDHNTKVVEASDVIILSVKPQIVKEVVLELRPMLSEEKLLVSIAAGIKLKDLQEWAGHGRLIRVMTNSPSAVGEAASVMSMGEKASKADEKCIASLFGGIGKLWRANENCFDAVTGLSGSGPAYIYVAIEAMADGGVAAGLPRDLALSLASQTVLGAATMSMKSGKHPAQLKDDTASPAGSTVAGIQELEKGGFRGTIMNAVIAAANRSQELPKRFIPSTTLMMDTQRDEELHENTEPLSLPMGKVRSQNKIVRGQILRLNQLQSCEELLESRESPSSSVRVFQDGLVEGVYQSRDELIDHVKSLSKIQGYVVTIQKSTRDKFVLLGCDRGGTYRSRSKLTDDQRKRKKRSRLLNCPFKVKGIRRVNGTWLLKIKSTEHNHEASRCLGAT